MPSPAGEGGRGPARGRMRGECAAITHSRDALASSALISPLTRTASVSALRAASGGCASTRACGRSPAGEALETQKRGRFRALFRLSKKVCSPLGPLCEGAPPAGGGGENCTAVRNISGYGKVLSLRPFGAPPSQREVFRHAEEDAFAPSFLFTDTHTSFSPSQQTLRCIPAPWPRRQLPQARCRPHR